MSGQPCIIRKSDGKVFAHAKLPDQVIQLEDNWYFHPDAVDHSLFETSDRTYTCPDKGTCLWVDHKMDKGYINDVAWIYPEPKPKYHNIAGWYGFYANHRIYTHAERE